MLEQYGLNRVGFLTLTFEDDVDDVREANRRLDSLMTNFLREKLVSYVLIRERQKRGAWHFHLLAVLPFDIKSKGRFTKLPKGGYKFQTTNVNLINLWRELREAMPRYGFGRHELLPVRKDSKSVASYLSKYIGKHMSARKLIDKGVRLVSYSQGFVRAVATQFSWHSPFMSRLRKKVYHLAVVSGCSRHERAAEDLGDGWGFRLFSQAAHLVRMIDISSFNRDQAHHVPWAPHVAFVDGQICRLDSGEIQF